MSILGRLTIMPRLPNSLARLSELAHNLYWTWDADARALFRGIDHALYERVGHNPLAVLREVPQARLDALASDPSYLRQLDIVTQRFDEHLRRAGWFAAEMAGSDTEPSCYAYFCAEYGWHEAAALYSGGLGILAGDHTKAASELGVPLVAVGLWYPEGYFHQRVAADGRQEAVYYRSSPVDQPFERVLDADGQPLAVEVRVFGRDIQVVAWRALVGRVVVYLLDVDVPDNHPEDRALLSRLYGGDQRTRIAQEIILGIGGVRLLRLLGVAPSSWHMNEGHSAFLVLERLREFVAAGMPVDAARELVTSNTLFTAHTPVPAGNDAFGFDLVSQAFAGDWNALGMNQQEFLDLGRADHGWGPVFSMPALAIRFTSFRNGVAALHGDTTRRMWSELWPEVPLEEVPIGHVTNGVHAATWVAAEVRDLVGEVLPDDWRTRIDDVAMWAPVADLEPDALWRVRQSIKRSSVRFLRGRVARQLRRQEASATVMADASHLFNPATLTIGFARRFATYKRATLIFRDLDRLARILNHPERPVQLVFAGKAHPADQPGQELVRQIHTLSDDPRFHGKLIFMEDYDMAVGRALTRGVDVWLNNPRRPLEASGTSGQKAAMNGVLNLSILDGWWPEGFDGYNGWAIGGKQTFADEARADEADADALYDLLEREVVPLYYDRDDGGVPTGWMRRAARAIATVTPRFNAQRMVKDYVRSYYAPASLRGRQFAANNAALATELATWRKRMREQWPNVHFQAKAAAAVLHTVGERLEVEALLHPRGVALDDIVVELVYAAEEPTSGEDLQRGLRYALMEIVGEDPDGAVRYRVDFTPDISGRIVYGVRAYPTHPGLAHPLEAGMLRWA